MLQEIMEKERSVDIMELLFVVKKNIALILAVGVLAGLLGFSATKYLMIPVYEASATMIVNTRMDLKDTVTNDQITSAKNLVDTYAIIIQSGRVLNQVIGNLGLKESFQELQQKTMVESINETQVMRVSVRDPDPEKALAILSEMVNIAPDTIIYTVEAGSGQNHRTPYRIKGSGIARYQDEHADGIYDRYICVGTLFYYKICTGQHVQIG